MVHSKFKSFELQNSSAYNEGEIAEFLKSGNDIHSLSICEIPVRDVNIVTLGYGEPSKASTGKIYALTSFIIGKETMTAEEINAAITSHAENNSGVKCLDVTCIDGDLVLTILTVSK